MKTILKAIDFLACAVIALMVFPAIIFIVKILSGSVGNLLKKPVNQIIGAVVAIAILWCYLRWDKIRAKKN
jgi:hypothetical protein